MPTAFTIFAIGLAMSAFFSGSETGFYRVARVRLLIDAVGGGWVARGLLWASNNPAAFVATALVGNNVANYVTSLAVVMGSGLLFPGSSLAEMLAPIAVAPVVFVYGELLPKNLFYQAPYRLLRRCAPALAFSAVLFAPISLLLWLVSGVLQKIGRAPTQTIRMAIARRELSEVFDEGQALGLLTSSQRGLAQGMFALGGKPIRDFMTPAAKQAKATAAMTRPEVLRLATRLRRPVLPVEDPANKREVQGYIRVVDCMLSPNELALPVKPLPAARDNETYLAVLLRMQEADEPMLAVHNAAGKLVGFVATEQLREALLGENAA